MPQVYLYMYDISNGMAKVLSPMILGRQLEAIWHTSIVMNDVEYLYAGGAGVVSSTPEETPFGRPQERKFMGVTDKTQTEFEAWNSAQEQTKFGPNSYNILHRNCNHYTEDALRFLCDVAQPDTVGKMTETVMSSPLGQIISQFVEGITQQMTAQYANQPNRTAGSTASASASTTPTPAPARSEKTHWCHVCDVAVSTKVVDGEVECVLCKSRFVEEWSPEPEEAERRETPENDEEEVPEISSSGERNVSAPTLESIITALTQVGVENIAQAVATGITRMISLTESNGNDGSRAAPASVINNLPLIRIDFAPEDPCPICQEDFTVGTQVASLPCSHIYHPDCIKNWLRLRNTCPSCRFELS
eukprot:TRINITY_DN2778_c1_g1_i1.p1 TRINITY_DN2778_c1_g1~~TRINITY_DN2778_c1_g1_i1.p1  ORF type:complete len:375 (+),score=81.32 TRINITY_DN2778_c1_g1_i1:43-1125(+)